MARPKTFHARMKAFRTDNGLKDMDQLMRAITSSAEQDDVARRALRKWLKGDIISFLLRWCKIQPALKSQLEAYAYHEVKRVMAKEMTSIATKGWTHDAFESSSDLTRSKLQDLTLVRMTQRVRSALPFTSTLVVGAAGQVLSNKADGKIADFEKGKNASKKPNARQVAKYKEECQAHVERKSILCTLALAPLAFHLNRRFNFFQVANSLSLWASQASKTGIQLFNQLGLSMSYDVLNDCLRSLSQNTSALLKNVCISFYCATSSNGVKTHPAQ